jgi:hypothetical protein
MQKSTLIQTDHKEPLMTIADLSLMTEGSLLCVAEILLKPKFHNLKPHEILTVVTGCSRSVVDQCKIDKGCIGGTAWLKIEKQLGQQLYHLWLEAQ